MVGWYYRLSGHELEKILGDSEGQGSLAYCNPYAESLSTNQEKNNAETAILISFTPLSFLTARRLTGNIFDTENTRA